MMIFGPGTFCERLEDTSMHAKVVHQYGWLPVCSVCLLWSLAGVRVVLVCVRNHFWFLILAVEISI